MLSLTPGFVGNHSPPVCQKPRSVPDGSITPTAQPSHVWSCSGTQGSSVTRGWFEGHPRGRIYLWNRAMGWTVLLGSYFLAESPKKNQAGRSGFVSSTHGCLSSWKETGTWLSFCLQMLPEVAAVSRSFLVESEKSSTRDQLPPIRCCLCCPAAHSPQTRRAAAAQDEALPWWLFSSAARKEDMTPK